MGFVEYVKIRPEDKFLLESYAPIIVDCAGSFYYNNIGGARKYAAQLLGDDPDERTRQIFQCALAMMENREGTKTKMGIVQKALKVLDENEANK